MKNQEVTSNAAQNPSSIEKVSARDARPVSSDGFMEDLRAFAGKLGRARFYITLKGDGISSGFYAESMTLADAKREAAAHKAKYPCWKSAVVRQRARVK